MFSKVWDERSYKCIHKTKEHRSMTMNRPFCDAPCLLPYFASSIMISLLLATNFVIASGARGACWILARS